MNNLNLLSRSISVLVLMVVGLAACDSADTPRVVSLAGPRVWLDQPVDGGSLPIGSFTLKSHARDTRGGVARISFLVNDINLGTVPTNPAQDLVYAEFAWNASVPGIHTIVALAANSSGQESRSAMARVCVGSSCPESATATITPSAVPTGSNVIVPPAPSGGQDRETPVPTVPGATPSRTPTLGNAPIAPQATQGAPITTAPSPTMTRTPTRTLTPVPPPPPPQGCTGMPSVASFSVSPTVIAPGSSATLSWGAVTNADSVTIDHGIGGVAAPGSRTVSPAGTTIYTLTAQCGNNTATRQVTLTVQGQQPPPPPPPSPTPTRTSTPPPPPPTRTLTPVPPQPPAAPTGLSQIGIRPCANPDVVELTWNDTANETGFVLYRRVRAGGIWGAFTVRANPGANITKFTDNSGFKSADRLEYYVQATNSAGASAPSNTLTVIECPF